MLSKEQVYRIVRANTGKCRCDVAYTSRHLEDPQCAWHDVGKGIVQDLWEAMNNALP